MKRYEEYKDTRIKWISKIPISWEEIRFKYALPMVTTKSTSDVKIGLENIESYSAKFIHTDSVFEGNGIETKKGDILYGKLRPYLAKVLLAEYDCNAVGDFYVFRCNESLCTANFAKWLILSDNFTKICSASTYGAKMPRVSSDFINSLYIPLPPLAEQERIVRFLEDKTSKIDVLLEEKGEQIQLLNELKESEIANIITRGLNPDVKMKDSGIPWIGMIPEHWKCTQLRSYLRMVSIKNKPTEQLLSVVREKGVIVRDVESKEENHNYIPDDLSGYKYVSEGQFVINKMKAWQGSYAVSKYNGIVSPAYYVCDLKFLDKDFFNLAIRSKFYIPFFTQFSKGIRVGQWDLSPIGLKSIPFFEPPIEEQKAIVAYIEDKCNKITSLISELEAEIEYLKEYKQKLIADCVTGQINVQ